MIRKGKDKNKDQKDKDQKDNDIEDSRVPRERVSNGAEIKFAGLRLLRYRFWDREQPAARNRLLSRNQRRYGSRIIPRTYGPPRPLFMALPLPCGHHFYYPLTSSSSFLAR